MSFGENALFKKVGTRSIDSYSQKIVRGISHLVWLQSQPLFLGLLPDRPLDDERRGETKQNLEFLTSGSGCDIGKECRRFQRLERESKMDRIAYFRTFIWLFPIDANRTLVRKKYVFPNPHTSPPATATTLHVFWGGAGGSISTKKAIAGAASLKSTGFPSFPIVRIWLAIVKFLIWPPRMFEGAAGSCKEKSRCPVSILGSKRERGEILRRTGLSQVVPGEEEIFVWNYSWFMVKHALMKTFLRGNISPPVSKYLLFWKTIPKTGSQAPDFEGGGRNRSWELPITVFSCPESLFSLASHFWLPLPPLSVHLPR